MGRGNGREKGQKGKETRQEGREKAKGKGKRGTGKGEKNTKRLNLKKKYQKCFKKKLQKKLTILR